MTKLPTDVINQKPAANAAKETEEVRESVSAFVRWLERHGYQSHDPYDIWGTAYGHFAKRLYYDKPWAGAPFLAPVVLMEVLLPGMRRWLVGKERFATADAQLTLAFLNLYEITRDRDFLNKAVALARDLEAYSVPGYNGLCWGYPFDWQACTGFAPKNTPFITTTPYCFEAFLALADATGEAHYLDAARSVATFVSKDLKDTPAGDEATAGSYSPIDNSRVINASAYRAYVLFEAANRFGVTSFAEQARKNLRFILQSQRSDGAWLYAVDNPRENFIDHFHTCFVLKNLFKLNIQLQDRAIGQAIKSGFAFYRRQLFDDKGVPVSFALSHRTEVVRLEMYNVAEAITLGVLLRDQPGAFSMAKELGLRACREYQLPQGHFLTRIYSVGIRHTFPFLRWPQAQMFYAMTNLLRSLEKDSGFKVGQSAALTSMTVRNKTMQINVLEYFEATVAQFPQKPAVIDRERNISFKELQNHALALAARLTHRADCINQPIAVFLPKGADAVISFLAILSSGNFYVPMDVKSPGPRVQSILQNLNPTLVITSPANQDELLKTGWPEAKTLLLDGTESSTPSLKPSDSQKRRSHLTDTDPVYIIYTSGSTGVPKGVVIPHRGVIDYIDWARDCYQVSEKEIIGSQAPFFFDNSTLDLYLCFSTGATLVLVPEDLFSFPIRLIEYARKMNLTTIFWVPSVLTSVANFNVLDKTQLPPLKKILFAGEVMPTRTLNYWRQRYPAALCSNLYGPTEITVDCTYYIVDREFGDNEPLPIGIPCRNTDILVLNDQNQLSAAGEIGELCVRGSSLALGYWDAPEKTAAAFTQNPLNMHYPERIYRTGDLVFVNPRGEIIFVGRKDSQIKHQGYRIELGEIETAVLALPELGSACVLYNKDKKEITLFYETKGAISPAQIRQKLSQQLSKYMLPTAFHAMTSLPLNANGKIDRLALASRYFVGKSEAEAKNGTANTDYEQHVPGSLKTVS